MLAPCRSHADASGGVTLPTRECSLPCASLGISTAHLTSATVAAYSRILWWHLAIWTGANTAAGCDAPPVPSPGSGALRGAPAAPSRRSSRAAGSRPRPTHPARVRAASCGALRPPSDARADALRSAFLPVRSTSGFSLSSNRRRVLWHTLSAST